MASATQPPIEVDTPDWFQRFARRLPDYFQLRFPNRPVKVFAVAATADLPAAADFTGCILFNRALGALCLSDGAHWFPVTMGAHL